MASERPLIALLEDDPFDRKNAIIAISSVIRKPNIQSYVNEAQFRDAIPYFQSEQPDLFVLDRRVRWTDPAPQFRAMPPDVESGGYLEAGERSAKLLRASGLTAPIIFWSIDESPFPDLPAVHFVSKLGDGFLLSRDILARQIREIIP